MKLICPKCGKKLKREGGRFCCEEGHSYDVAKEGYVNLVLANQKHSKLPGDEPAALSARNRFLLKGYYKPLAQRLSNLTGSLFHDGESYLDAGCGTGYYLKYIKENCSLKLDCYGCDVSKKGISLAARSDREITWFVGNVFHLPFEDNSLDGLMSVFCPYSGREFGRIIREGGYVISVTPGRDHLYSLKETVYEEPYYNEEKTYDLPGFELVSRENVVNEIHLADNEDIRILWMMMPYAHNTSRKDSEKLLSRDELDTLTDFLVCVYRKVSS